MSEESGNEIRQIRKAIKEVRREGLKASFIHAVIDSALVLIGLKVGLSMASISRIPESVTIDVPASVSSSIPLGSVVEITGSTVVALAVTLVFFAIDLGIVYRRRTVEMFEEINPEVEEALRTARDASEDGEDNEMARALYDDVIERLQSTSSAGFVSGKRILSTFLILAVVALIGVSITMLGGPTAFGDGFGLFGGGSGGDGNGAGATKDGQREQQYTGLQDPDSVLGESQDTGSGSQNLGVNLKESGSSGVAGGSG
ncbi:MAG: hypothetical protein SXQ77_10210, partial [Halobacteria archaeon]|nr:hypothetical protein [Halobacteria archaeon]